MRECVTLCECDVQSQPQTLYLDLRESVCVCVYAVMVKNTEAKSSFHHLSRDPRAHTIITGLNWQNLSGSGSNFGAFPISLSVAADKSKIMKTALEERRKQIFDGHVASNVLPFV